MEMSQLPSPDKKGRLYIVGIGPGSVEQLTGAALKAIRASEYVIGSGTYLDMIASLLDGKRVIRSGMGREVERAHESLELSRESTVAVVSGGDPGIYGMAGIVLEVAEKMGIAANIEVIPGVTAASASAALLGSPLSGDYVSISLSDLLTPWDIIRKRLCLAFSMGVPVVLYNPRSRGRPGRFREAMELALKARPPGTPVGIVRNAYREGEQVIVTTLEKAAVSHDDVDMHTTVIVGGEESRIWRTGNGERIITPRGYHRKYEY
ncbi:precorrin-3B C(17)-methyltransferase [Methanocella conradii]|uniref:precorrin-3B C(17)-methyltransferase n=1 Tax=Methanocella conradii TaxID=1175444 RepID=UPI00157C40ED|nr:precorrin-3B C(17)-methyltransferase [Methanocella conradii]